MFTCEAMFLLLTTDAGKDEPWVSYREEALRGAVLADLAMLDLIAFDEEDEPLVRVTASNAPPSSALAHGLQVLRERQPVAASEAVQANWFAPAGPIAADLSERGILRSETTKFLFFSTERFPTVDAEPEAQLRAGLAAVLAAERAPSQKELVLLAILDEMSAVRTVLRAESAPLNGKELTARLAELRAVDTDHDEVTAAVAAAIRVMQSLMSAAFIATMP